MSNTLPHLETLQIVPVGERAVDAVELLRPMLDRLFASVVVQDTTTPAVDTAGTLSRQTGSGSTALVCTGSAFRELDSSGRLPDRRLLVVDLDSSLDPADGSLSAQTTYLHPDSPERQLVASVRSAFATAPGTDGEPDSDIQRAQNADTPSLSLARLFVETPAPTLAVDAETGVVVALNDAGCESLCRSRESILGSSYDELYADREQVAVRGAQQSAPAGDVDDHPADEQETRYIETGNGSLWPVETVESRPTVDGRTYRVVTLHEASAQFDQQSELRRRSAAMDASLTGLSILSERGEYVYMNEAHAEIFGYTPGELLGEHWRRLYTEAVQADIEAGPFAELEQTGSWAGELTGSKKDGSSVEQYVSLTRLDDGGLVCVNRDISERKRTERQVSRLRDSVETFMLADDRETVIDHALESMTERLKRPLVGYCRYDAGRDELQPLQVSERARALFDDVPVFERGEGLAWESFVEGTQSYYPDLGAVESVYNPETPIESELLLPVGEHGIFIIGSTEPDGISETERKLLGIVGTHVQTALTLLDRETALATARETAERKRQQLRDVIDTVPQMIFCKDQSGAFIFANEAVAEAYGTTVSRIEGKTDADLAPEQSDVTAFREDDRRVLESGDPVHRSEETLTDVDGNERLLDTWKIPFDPVRTDERAVLGVSTDVTELKRTQRAVERLRRLKAFHRVGDELLRARTPADVYEIGVEVVAEGVGNSSVAVYRWKEPDGLLRRMATASTPEHHPETVTVDEQTRWRAFTTGQTGWLDGGSDRAPALAVPVGSVGLLVVAGVEDRTDEFTEFVESAAGTLAVGIRQATQKASIDRLRSNIERYEEEMTRATRGLSSLTRAIDRILGAESRSELDRILVEFVDANWPHGWVGGYRPQQQAVVPRRTSAADGPAAEVTAESPNTPPALEAVTTREPVQVERIAGAQRQSEWASRMLTYGYQSAVAVPVTDEGTIYGVLEVAATQTDAFDDNTVESLRVACRTAAIRLKQLGRTVSTASDDTIIEVDLSFEGSRPLFPALPTGASVQVRRIDTVDSTENRLELTFRGIRPGTLERYVSQTPGLYDTQIATAASSSTDGGTATVRLHTERRDPTRVFFETLAASDIRLCGARSTPSTELVTVRGTQQAAVRAAVEAVGDRLADSRVAAKRTRQRDTTVTSRSDQLAALTDRQREIIRTAYQEGYYDQPKQINGGELGEFFSISRSTVHEHLRTAERKLVAVLFDGDHRSGLD
jgi:PAS domain S-box-containing protein